MLKPYKSIFSEAHYYSKGNTNNPEIAKICANLEKLIDKELLKQERHQITSPRVTLELSTTPLIGHIPTRTINDEFSRNAIIECLQEKYLATGWSQVDAGFINSALTFDDWTLVIDFEH